MAPKKDLSGPSRVQPQRGDPAAKLRAVFFTAIESFLGSDLVTGKDLPADSPTQESAWGALSDVIAAEFVQLHQRIKELEETVAKLAEAPATITITKFKKQLDTFETKLAEQAQHHAATAKEHQEAIVATANANKSYTEAVLGSKPAQPMRQSEPYRSFRVTSHGAKQLPTTTHDALKFAEGVLNGINKDNKIRAADVSIQRSKHEGLSKGKPQAVIISVLPGDACTLKPLLWEKHVQDKLHGAGLRISTHLPQDEFKSKQALWGQFGKQMRAWLTDGKPLIYSNRHQSVTVEGGEVLKLPVVIVATGNSPN